MNLSENLQNLRKAKGMSQEELAEKLDVSRQAVSKWETGETSPETEKIIMICDLFDCTMDDLIKGKVMTEINVSKKAYDKFMNKFSKGMAFGVFMILVGVTLLLTIIGLAPKDSLDRYIIIGVVVLMFFVIITVPLLVYAGIQKSKYDMDSLRNGHMRLSKEAEEKIGRISAVIMICATIIYFILGFVFKLWTINWLVYPIGGMICGIVSVINSKED